MTERKFAQDSLVEGMPRRVFDNPPQSAPAPIIQFLSLAEQEGVYATLSETTRQRIEMRFLEGLPIAEIAGLQNVTKQAISQTLKMFPKILSRKMTEDFLLGKTTISYSKIDDAYLACEAYLAEERKRMGSFSNQGI